MAAVAPELGLSDRTVQRRMIADGATFRRLLLEVRQEPAHKHLNRPDMDVTEAASARLRRFEFFLSSFPNVGGDDTLAVEGSTPTICN